MYYLFNFKYIKDNNYMYSISNINTKNDNYILKINNLFKELKFIDKSITGNNDYFDMNTYTVEFLYFYITYYFKNELISSRIFKSSGGQRHNVPTPLPFSNLVWGIKFLWNM